MQYMVLAADGNEYGPADLDTLKNWVSEGRIQPSTQLRETVNGQVVAAATLTELFPPSAPVYSAAAPHPQFARPQSVPQVASGNSGVLIGVVLRSLAGVAFFFFLGGLGIIFCGYALFYAIQAKSSGDKNGTIAIVIASVSLLAVVIGWILRLNGAKV